MRFLLFAALAATILPAIAQDAASQAYHRGAQLLAQGKFEEAEQAFMTSWAIDPSTVRGVKGVIEVYMTQKQPDKALAVVADEAAKKPGNLELTKLYADTAQRVGNLDVAVTQTQKALSLAKDDRVETVELTYKLGDLYRQRKEYDKALETLKRAQQMLARPNPGIQLSMALSFDLSGNLEAARSLYEGLLKSAPENIAVLNNLAYVLAVQGTDLDRALLLALRAQDLQPSNMEIQDTVAFVYVKKNMADQALPILQGLVQKMPSSSNYHYHLGLALQQKGNKDGARQQFEAALANKPAAAEEARIKSALSSLQ